MPAAREPAALSPPSPCMGKVSGRQVRVNMTGGQLIVDVDLQGSTVQNLYLTGPTNIVCKGEVTDEELSLNR